MRHMLLVFTLSLVPAASAQEFGQFDSMDVEAGIIEFNYETGRDLALLEGAHVVLHDADTEDVELFATNIRFEYASSESTGPDVIRFDKKVKIIHPQMTIVCEEAEWKTAENAIEFRGNPKMESSSGLFSMAKGSEMRLNLNTNSFTIHKGIVENLNPGAAREAESDPTLLSTSDLADTAGFVALFKKQAAADGASPGKQLLSVLDPEVGKVFMALSPEEVAGDVGALLKQLNKAVVAPKLYDAKAWDGIALPEAAAALAAKDRASLTAEEVVVLNRAALAAAYPRHIQAMKAGK